jgi:hypothetical protein
MAAIARAWLRAASAAGEDEALKTILLFCGAGLLISLLFMTYGLDLSPGFF